MEAEWRTNGHWDRFEGQTVGKWIGEDGSRRIGR